MPKKKEPLSLKTLDAEAELKKIGARIRELRKQKGFISYEAFAKHDVHQVQWGSYEQGLDMYSSTLIKVIKLLGVSVKEFFSDGSE